MQKLFVFYSAKVKKLLKVQLQKFTVTVKTFETKFFGHPLYPYVLKLLWAQESKSAFKKYKYGSYFLKMCLASGLWIFIIYPLLFKRFIFLFFWAPNSGKKKAMYHRVQYWGNGLKVYGKQLIHFNRLVPMRKNLAYLI